MRKGQAAMEFLMTYGWAILVVLVAIGALAYFGVLNPARFLPESCTLTPGLGCDDFQITADTTDGIVQLEVRNGMGTQIDFSSIYVDVDKDGAFNIANDCGVAGAVYNPAALTEGSTASWTFDDCPAITAGRFTANIIGTYTKASSTLTHSINGQISGTAA